MARLFGLKGLCKSAFRVHAQQQQPQQPGQQLVVGGLGQMDLAAIRELEALRDAFVPRPGNQRFRFHYLFLNVVDDPAQRASRQVRAGLGNGVGKGLKPQRAARMQLYQLQACANGTAIRTQWIKGPAHALDRKC